MAVTVDEFESMHIRFRRSIRAPDSEVYNIFSDLPEVGPETGDNYRAGKIIIQYIPTELSKVYVLGTLLLEREWEEKAAQKLAWRIDNDIVDAIGGGSSTERGTFDVDMYQIEEIGYRTDSVDHDYERGFYGMQRQISQNRTLIEAVPELVSESVDDVVNDHYEEFEEIIDSNMEKEEKKKQIQRNLRLGLERGLPTALYEIGEKE